MSFQDPSRRAPDAAAKLSELFPQSHSYDRHERNDPFTSQQRQQRQLPQQTPPPQTPESRSTPATPASQPRSLRRIPRFGATPSPQPQPVEPELSRQPLPRVTVTLGPRGQYVLTSAEEQARPRRRRPRRQLSQELSSEDLTDTSPRPASQYHHNRTNLSSDEPEAHRVVRISKHTHSAILYALEETLRGPHKLSSDIVEEQASMSDLLGGGGLATSNSNGGSSSRPVAARAPVGSPSGIRGPRVIMQERQAREARQREERERIEREHAEQEARLLSEANRREEERRAAAGAGVSASGSMPTGPDTSAARRMSAAASARAATDNGARVTGSSRIPAGMQTQSSQRPARTTQETGGPSASGAEAAGPSVTQQQTMGSEALTATGRGRNSFPHAFERWETLSAHWEGLTSFWIRRLEQNTEEISQDPVSQQLARQVTDLSSAGANLFHAVVELQRLRASSERKFQRWFFDTRAEMERNQEVTAMLQAALEEERQGRATAIREALENDKGSSKMQKQLAEMRKELQISKEEARRAWEELGRREQEERDRTASLQLGQPTIVGGVQVVPMTQGVSRGNSQRDPRSYAPVDPSEFAGSTSGRPEFTQAPAVQPVVTSAGGVSYQQTPTTVQHQGSYGSEGTYSEEEFETPASQPGVHYPPTGIAQPQYSSAPDYSGSGYSVPGWETMPRHHHPTRLSDVIEEEDERSRTSASQSQVSRG